MAAEMQPVRSSNVAEVGWDEEKQELLIQFKDGSTYAYPNSDKAAYQDLLTASSPGQYINRWLRSKPHRKLS